MIIQILILVFLVIFVIALTLKRDLERRERHKEFMQHMKKLRGEE